MGCVEGRNEQGKQNPHVTLFFCTLCAEYESEFFELIGDYKLVI